MFNFLEKIWSYVDIGAGIVFSIIALNFIAFIFLMFAKKNKNIVKLNLRTLYWHLLSLKIFVKGKK